MRYISENLNLMGMFYDADSPLERLVFSDWSHKTVDGVPFLLVDPRGDRNPNVILLHGPQGQFPPRMPKAVELPCHTPARAIHLLSGVSGWGYPGGTKGSVSMIVRLHYADGSVEDHPLENGIHFADWYTQDDVPASRKVLKLKGRGQMRYLVVYPRDVTLPIKSIDLVKGKDTTSPVIMAMTVEKPGL